MSSFLRRFGLFALIALTASAPVTVRAADEEEADPYYETFFASQILSMTQANLAIGVTADAIAKKLYEGDAAVTIAATHGQLVEGLRNITLGIAKTKDLDEEDAELLKKVAHVYDLLKGQADTVVGIAKGDDGEKFAKSRAECGKAIDSIIKEIGEYFKE